MIPNKRVVKAIQDYDKKLYVKWNNCDSVWEVWRKMPWGNRLITPITRNIYNPGASCSFCPLDYRIMTWLYGADSQRKDLPLAWKWKAKKQFLQNSEISNKKYKTKLEQSAKDNYYIINNELINLFQEDTGWQRPDVNSTTGRRTMYRKEYYDYDSNRDD